MVTEAVGRTVAAGRREDTRQELARKKCSTIHKKLPGAWDWPKLKLKSDFLRI